MASTPTRPLRQALTARSAVLRLLLVFLRLILPSVWTNVQFLDKVDSNCSQPVFEIPPDFLVTQAKWVSEKRIVWTPCSALVVDS